MYYRKCWTQRTSSCSHCLFSPDYNDLFAHRWHEQSDAPVCVGKGNPATAVDILPTFPIYAKAYIEWPVKYDNTGDLCKVLRIRCRLCAQCARVGMSNNRHSIWHMYSSICDIYCQNTIEHQWKCGVQQSNGSAGKKMKRKRGRQHKQPKHILKVSNLQSNSLPSFVSTSLPCRGFAASAAKTSNWTVKCEKTYSYCLYKKNNTHHTHTPENISFSGAIDESNENSNETTQCDTLFSYSISSSDGMTYWLECCACDCSRAIV